VGIRPESMTIVPVGSPDAVLQANVALVEPLGAKDVVHVSSERRDVRVIAKPGARPRLGESIGIAIDPRKVHLFDDETGEAIR
jgi:multiple sugar transport system ATP-binding protein